MTDYTFPSAPLQKGVLSDLATTLRETRLLWGPQAGTDGVCRILPLSEDQWPTLALTTLLPLKKLLLPPREELWNYNAGDFSPLPTAEPFAVLGVPLCDLQAAWYLDQVFADDEVYKARRARSFLVGMPCEPGKNCHCDGNLMPLAGDLFIGQERVWALSPAGHAMLQACACNLSENLPLSWPEEIAARRHAVTEKVFHASAESTIWSEEAQHCLSCGACSAVCPTCYCFDMLDDAVLDGSVTRSRAWDNCFFAEHGKIAGGHDFRSGRISRLRFRMEHKQLGFGPLRGQNSCVGCGRCREACPVDIDLDRIAERLSEEARP
jgi:ferredoxin